MNESMALKKTFYHLKDRIPAEIEGARASAQTAEEACIRALSVLTVHHGDASMAERVALKLIGWIMAQQEGAR